MTTQLAEIDTILFVPEIFGMWTERDGTTTITEYDRRGSDR